MSDSLFEDIVNSNDIDSILEENDSSSSQAWLVFSAGTRDYAVNSIDVKQILRNNSIFPIPFAPQYVKGIVNCNSKPMAVIDFSLFQGYGEQLKNLFLILKNKSDVAFQITDVKEFQNSMNVTVQDFPDKTDVSFFSGAINLNDTIIPILDIESIINKVKVDLENC